MQQQLVRMRWRRFVRDNEPLLRMLGRNVHELEGMDVLRRIAAGETLGLPGFRESANAMLDQFVSQMIVGTRPRADLVFGMLDGQEIARASLLPPAGSAPPPPAPATATRRPADHLDDGSVRTSAASPEVETVASSSSPVTTAQRAERFQTALDLIQDSKARDRFRRASIGVSEDELITYTMESNPVRRAELYSEAMASVIARHGADSYEAAAASAALLTFEKTYGNSLRELSDFLIESSTYDLSGVKIGKVYAPVLQESRAAQYLAAHHPELFATLMKAYGRSVTSQVRKEGRIRSKADIIGGPDFEQFLLNSLPQRVLADPQLSDIQRKLRGLSARTEDFSEQLSQVLEWMRNNGYSPPDISRADRIEGPRTRFDNAEPVRDASAMQPGDRVDHPIYGRGTVFAINGDEVHVYFDRTSTGSLSLAGAIMDQAPPTRAIRPADGELFTAAADDGTPLHSLPFRSQEEQAAMQAMIDHLRTIERLGGWEGDTSHGTAAIAIANGRAAPGASSKTSARLYQLTLEDRRLMATMLDLGSDTKVNFLSHAEAAALIRLRRHLADHGESMPATVDLFVDRALCASCQADLYRIADLLGLSELRVYFRDRVGKPPIIIKPAQ